MRVFFFFRFLLLSFSNEDKKPENEQKLKSLKKQKTSSSATTRDGNWEDVSGQTFLRKLLSMPIGEAKYDVGRPAMCEFRVDLFFFFFHPFPSSFFPFLSFPLTFFFLSLLFPFSLHTDDHVKGMGVDPRSMAQRIMDIRSQLAREWVEDLGDVSEENALLLRESAAASLRTIAEHPFDSSTDEEESGDEGGAKKGGSSS